MAVVREARDRAEPLAGRCLHRAEQASVLVDASEYYGALRSALLAAEHSVFIVGWDVDSRAPIRGEKDPTDGAPQRLGGLLAYVAERNPDLQIHILLWDYAILYATERELLPRVSLDWRTPDNVKVRLDDFLPLGASHHEKIVIVDDVLAFCGGLDLAIRRWDTPEHRPDDSRRQDPAGEGYGPFHDLQLMVTGDVVEALAENVRERWSLAGGSLAERRRTRVAPWPSGIKPDFRDVPIRIVRTRAQHDGRPALMEVEAAYLEAIATAEKLIYIETQYLTAPVIAQALRARLIEREDLDLVLVTSAQPSGWLEMQTMGHARARFLSHLRDLDCAARVHVVYPWVGRDEQRENVKVHAKLMIVDDRFLQIGSANLNKRSMYVDTECDLRVEPETAEHRRTIENVRNELLAEHLGIEADAVAEHLRGPRPVGELLKTAAQADRGVAPLELPAASLNSATQSLTHLADPEKPLEPHVFIGDMFDARRVKPLAGRIKHLAAIVLALLVLIGLWRVSPLSDWRGVAQLLAYVDAVGGSAWAGPAVLGAFVGLSFVMFPVTVMIAATALVLGPWQGFMWALAGCLASGAANYAAGRFLGRRLLRGRMLGLVKTLRSKIRRSSLFGVALVRNLPIAPFTMVNLAAGAASVPFRDFMTGTVLGMTPGIAALTILGDRLAGFWRDPSPGNVALLLLAAALWIGIALGLQAVSNRVGRR